ncbi:MAG: Asp-tRNA(Asn)/Glu-tRNA(Gln) amidotransferase subunit GatC [Leptospiraceae bacterium]|nr:Asp-tRNA(Asn)/Glu-tRNA(Gln) amidotransferase subunit GatC [Leptospiraceae bacterium]
MNKKELLEIANLAKLRIDENEISSFLEDFNNIVSYVDSVKELNVTEATLEDIYLNHENTMRLDEPKNTLSRDEISSFAPEFENGYVVVPRVIET